MNQPDGSFIGQKGLTYRHDHPSSSGIRNILTPGGYANRWPNRQLSLRLPRNSQLMLVQTSLHSPSFRAINPVGRSSMAGITNCIETDQKVVAGRGRVHGARTTNFITVFTKRIPSRTGGKETSRRALPKTLNTFLNDRVFTSTLGSMNVSHKNLIQGLLEISYGS